MSHSYFQISITVVCVCVCVCVCADRRGSKDYSRPVGFVSAGVQGGTREEGEGEGGSDSEEEVI